MNGRKRNKVIRLVKQGFTRRKVAAEVGEKYGAVCKVLAQEKVKTIEAMLAGKELSRREIARRVGVNRETVNRIANNERPDYVAVRRFRARRQPRHLTSPIRCPGCGFKVAITPCQICHLRQLGGTGEVRHAFYWEAASQSYEVELTGEYLERYLEIFAEKIRRGKSSAFPLAFIPPGPTKPTNHKKPWRKPEHPLCSTKRRLPRATRLARAC